VQHVTKPVPVKILQWLHLIIFVTAVGIIFVLHYYPEDFLDFLRVPLFLRDINSMLGSSWPVSLHIYQIILIFFLLLTLIDSLGLLFYHSKSWRIISDLSSFLGFLIIWPVALFFVFTLVSSDNLDLQNIKTALVYFIFSFSLFILDLVTWFVDEQSFLARGLIKIKRSIK